MPFEGEHLLPGQIGHLAVIIAFVTSFLSTIFYFIASKKNDEVEKKQWIKFARSSFSIQIFSILLVFGLILFLCANHYFEYMYAYKHASKELEAKYLLACVWEGQEGSFLLWSIWHCVLGLIIIKKEKYWETPVMTVISLAQFFLMMMLLGIHVFDVRLGSSPFILTRNEIAGPIFSRPNYLNLIKDGVGLNVLLRNYWMVIHPPILFLGFASTIIPFSFAYAGIATKRFSDWVKPALPWTLFSTCVLGVGIMMGGKWAYESLSFGGYWAWDPVENASLVPWLILVAGLHTMVIFKATGHSLRASYLFAFLTFIFILYSTYLTRTGILGDTSVHAFAEAGKATNFMILLFVGAFTIPSLFLFFKNIKNIPAEIKEEQTNSREFWMFIGSIVFFLTALFISAKTSVPVYNKIFGTKIAPPEDVEFSYNKVMALVAIIIGLLTAVTQYLKYKSTPAKFTLKKIAAPLLVAIIVTALLVIFYPLQYDKQGIGFLGALYVALFATVFSVVANASYIWIGMKGKLKLAGAAVAHTGFALMLVGMLLSSSNKQVISNSKVNGINLPIGKDAMTKKQDDPLENLTLIRHVPTTMGDYQVIYLNDSMGNEKGRRFYKLNFEKKDPVTKKIIEQFILWPDVYVMKDNNMSSNPDTKAYLGKDVFTYVSYALNDEKNETDTTQFKMKEIGEGDTTFYGNGYIILNSVERNPNNETYKYKPTDAALMANITLVSKDSMRYKAKPLVEIINSEVRYFDDTVYAQNLFLRFAGVAEGRKIKLGIKESDKFIDFIALKAYIFPQINLVWIGLIIMALGLTMSMIKRAKLNTKSAAFVLIVTALGLFYMFLFAN
jgi:cytochrome c-type biogenesis protein CcmF